MTDYELALIVRSSVEESEIKKTISSTEKEIEKMNGKIHSRDDWGMRKFSYKIEKEDTGYYYFIKFSLDSQLVSKLESYIKLQEKILRYLLSKLDN